jgi:hypothetical protein
VARLLDEQVLGIERGATGKQAEVEEVERAILGEFATRVQAGSQPGYTMGACGRRMLTLFQTAIMVPWKTCWQSLDY